MLVRFRRTILIACLVVTSKVFAKSHLLSPKELKYNLYMIECVLGKSFSGMKVKETLIFC